MAEQDKQERKSRDIATDVFYNYLAHFPEDVSLAITHRREGGKIIVTVWEDKTPTKERRIRNGD